MVAMSSLVELIATNLFGVDHGTFFLLLMLLPLRRHQLAVRSHRT